MPQPPISTQLSVPSLPVGLDFGQHGLAFAFRALIW
jgi:hypothetical protein